MIPPLLVVPGKKPVGAAYLAATGQPAPLWLLEKLTVPKADAVRVAFPRMR